uniref:RAB, member of RAS onco family-like 2A n=1 Tax=Gallus gallus TaxID=9031 RepID=A0A1D5PVH8_CHICK
MAEAAEQPRDEAPLEAGAEEAVKIICLGDSAVGKSKLLERFLLDGFRPQQLSTFALTLYQHRARVDGKAVLVADMKVTQKSFNFARKFSLPFYFVSAADGTNVVKLFNDAIKLAVTYKQNSGDFMDEVMQELESFDLEKKSENLSDQEESYPEEKPPSS